MTLWSDIKETSKQVENARTEWNVLQHLVTEVGELFQEKIIAEGRSYKLPGHDGQVGEAVDVMLCAADIILIRHPDLEEGDLISNWFGGMGKRDLVEAVFEDVTFRGRGLELTMSSMLRSVGHLSAGLERKNGSPARTDRLDAVSCSAYGILLDSLCLIKVIAPEMSLQDIHDIATEKLRKWRIIETTRARQKTLEPGENP